MLKELLNYLENKKIVILGFGMEGESSYRFLRKNFPEKQLFIADGNINLLNSKISLTELMEDQYVEFSVGEDYLNGIDQYDLILKAPGISLKDIDISKFENKITSQLELFLEYFDICSIGITGTKGKSTTSSLMYKILIDQEKQAFLLGNIGEPIFNDIENMSENSIAVIELSSHALEFVKKSTKIGIILDIYEEHLDHYKSLEKYIEAKFNLAKYQNENDFLIYNFDNEFIKNYKFNYKENDYAVSLENEPNTKNKVFLKDNFIYCNKEKWMNIDEQINLKGMHNINNIMFILAVCQILKLDINETIKSIKEFKPLEHRMEFVANINGVDYYNDSIATIPEATIYAINTIKNVNTLIVGGNDRGVNLTELINFLKLSKIENIICLPKTGEYIYEGLKESNKNIYFINEYKELYRINKNSCFMNELEEAVEIAKKITKKGSVCLLSPAASSYGYFKNFGERGRLFKKYVLENN